MKETIIVIVTVKEEIHIGDYVSVVIDEKGNVSIHKAVMGKEDK